MSASRLYGLQGIDVMGIQHQRLLTNNIAAQMQAGADKSVVGIVGCADGHPFDGGVAPHLLVAEPVENHMLCKKRAVGEIAVKQPHAVEAVIGSNQVISGIFNRPQMSGRYVAGYTGHDEIRHLFLFRAKESCPIQS